MYRRGIIPFMTLIQRIVGVLLGVARLYLGLQGLQQIEAAAHDAEAVALKRERDAFKAQAEYLREGDIQDNPDGSITLFPVRSDTDLLTFHVGFSVGIAR